MLYLCVIITIDSEIEMSEVELILLNDTGNCTLYSIQFSAESESEYERFFRYEGGMNDSVVALPVLKSKLRLYCLRLSDKILILGNGGIKNSRTYEEDDSLRGYVLTLQKFEELLKEGQRDGSVTITEKTIGTDNNFEL